MGRSLLSALCVTLFSHRLGKNNRWLICSSVEQVHWRHSGFFRLLHLWFGELNATHGNHSTDGKVSPNAANTKPERPVQRVAQNDKNKKVFFVVCHPLCQTVMSHGSQETQNSQGGKKSWKHKGGSVRAGTGFFFKVRKIPKFHKDHQKSMNSYQLWSSTDRVPCDLWCSGMEPCVHYKCKRTDWPVQNPQPPAGKGSPSCEGHHSMSSPDWEKLWNQKQHSRWKQPKSWI